MKLLTASVFAILLSSCVSISTYEEKLFDYGNGLVWIKLPTNWIFDTEREGNGIFFDNENKSSSLRLSVVSIKTNKENEIDSHSLNQALSNYRNGQRVVRLENGNLMKVYDEKTIENGSDLTLRFWEVAHIASNNCVRLAVFSYTSDTPSSLNKSYLDEIAYIEKSISNASISSLSCGA